MRSSLPAHHHFKNRRSLGVKLHPDSSEEPGLENGKFAWLWSTRMWVPCKVLEWRMGDRGHTHPPVPEVLLHELGRPDLECRWVEQHSPRIRKVDVAEKWLAAQKRGDFVKVGSRVRSAWAPADERTFWKGRAWPAGAKAA